jgi:cell division protein FtsL
VTTIAVSPRRAPARRSPGAGARPAPARTKAAPHAATRSLAVGRLGALLAFVTVFALVTAVVFHVVLAQNQQELDGLNGQIAEQQRVYEQRLLTTSVLASPEAIIEAAKRQGLAQPPEPAIYLEVPGAPLPRADRADTAATIGDWSKTKPSLAAQQP